MKRLITATIIIFTGLTFAAQANSDHWDKFSCYAYVHDQCYGEGSEGCDPEGHEWGLNECDKYYPDGRAVRPQATFGVAPSKKTTLQIRKKILRSFK